MFGKNFESKSLRKGGRMAHNVIALLFLFIPMVLFGKALFSYGTTSASMVGETFANQRIAESQVRSQEGVLFEEGIISLTFDDGWKSVATDAAPIMAEYKIASTQYVIADSIGKPGYMSVAQIKAMKAAGHQIASHGVSHIPLAEQSNETIKFEFEESRQRLIDLKLVSKDDHLDFAYPYGSRSEVTNDLGKTNYRSLRGAASGLNDGVDAKDINTKASFSQYSTFIAMTVDQNTKLSDIRKAIQHTKATKGWLVFNFHQIDSGDSEFAVSGETFRKIIHIIMDENIKTMTIQDTIASYKEAS